MSVNGFGYDFALVKLSGGTGATAWAKGFGSTAYDNATAVAVERSTGDVVITGKAGGPINLGGGLTSNGGVFVSKYSGVDGSYKWAKVLAANTGNGIAVDPTTGNVFVTGGFTGSVDFGGGAITTPWQQNGGMFLASYGPSGNYLWAKACGANGDAGNAVSVDGSGNVAFTGTAAGAIDFANTGIPTQADGFIVASFTTSGSYRWDKRGGTSWGNGIACDSLGHLLTTGSFDYTVDFGGNSLAAAGMPDGFVAQYTK